MRTPFIAGNWKMNKDKNEAVSLVKELINLVKDAKVDIAESKVQRAGIT